MTKKKQLRGEALKSGIELCLTQLADDNEKYVYNASELSKRVGCSRTTLNKYQDFIDEVLGRMNAEKRLKRDHPLLEQYQYRIEQLEADNKELQMELNALREHHASIYTTLQMQSVDAALLLRPVVQNESRKAKSCILCGHALPVDFEYPQSDSVVQLDDFR